MDHLSGLYRLVQQEGVTIANFWDITHDKDFTADDFEGTRYDYRDWQTYRQLATGSFGNKVLRLHRGDLGQKWVEDDITILSPTQELETTARDKEDYNIASYVLLIRHGHSYVVLGGDADSTHAWPDIHQVLSSEEWGKVKLLKASHHGRDSGYYQPVVKDMSPDYTIVSVGKKPETDASRKYAQYSRVFSTRYHGTIVAYCERDGSILLTDHRGQRIS